MSNYNATFFGLFENIFKLLMQEYGENEALKLFKNVMEMGLSKSYGNDFKKGDLAEFERLVGQRDNMVGLHVEFIRNTNDVLTYQFHDDPFPNLKGLVDPYKLDASYMNFKVRHILGEGWKYKTTKHLWTGDHYTEHLILKSS